MLRYIVISALLLFLAHPSASVAWLAWIALVPLLHALRRVRQRAHAWWYGYLHGWLFYAGLLYWIGHVTVIGCMLLVSYLACYTAAFSLGTAWLAGQRRPFFQHASVQLLLIPSWWVALEWVRNYAFSGFSWGLIGYTQAPHPWIIQSADLVGVYGISWLILFINVIIIQLIYRHTRRNTLALTTATLILCGSVIGYGVWRLRTPLTGQTVRIAVVQGNIEQQQKWDAEYKEYIMSRYERLTRDVAVTRPDLIIWPETAIPGILPVESWIMPRLRQLAHTVHTPLLIGTPLTTPDLLDPTLWNSALLLDRDGTLMAHYNKLHLVPFGEYIPLDDTLPWLRRVITTGDFDPGNETTVFHLPVQGTEYRVQSQYTDSELSTLNPSIPFSVLICFEDVFPEISRRFTRAGARMLVNMTNDAWFGHTSAPHQHLQASIFRAVEQRVPVVRSANTGVSAFIDAHGRVQQMIMNANHDPLFTTGIAVRLVTAPQVTTLYRQWGDWWVIVCASLLLIVGSIGLSKR